MTQKGIYISPDDTRPNRDRVDTIAAPVFSEKKEVLDSLYFTLIELNDIVTIEDSVDIARRLVKMGSIIESTINYLKE